ncbi:GIY-YIG nuclease family protein [bacterium]|nr:GIY-YIG nuclease family protein [bacterium]
MYYVYIIKSKKDNLLYTGSTKDLKKRFDLHNKGKIISTKNRIPFELIYYEAYKNEKEARQREKNLKLKANAFRQLKLRIKLSLQD